MGFRTVVMLNNDQADRWGSDPQLGAKIRTAMNDVKNQYGLNHGYDGVKVVECVHADTVTLAILEYYQGFDELSWNGNYGGTDEIRKQRKIDLLKMAAEKFGYKLVKKSTK